MLLQQAVTSFQEYNFVMQYSILIKTGVILVNVAGFANQRKACTSRPTAYRSFIIPLVGLQDYMVTDTHILITGTCISRIGQIYEHYLPNCFTAKVPRQYYGLKYKPFSMPGTECKLQNSKVPAASHKMAKEDKGLLSNITSHTFVLGANCLMCQYVVETSFVQQLLLQQYIVFKSQIEKVGARRL